jgi:hypothetical protein
MWKGEYTMDSYIEEINDEGALVKMPAWYDGSDEIVICDDRLIEHTNMDQSDEYRYSAETLLFEDIENIRQNRQHVFVDVGVAEGGTAIFRFPKIRPAKAFARVLEAGVAKPGSREFDKRVAVLVERGHATTDTTVRVTRRIPPTYDPEKREVWQSMKLESAADGEKVMEMLRENPSPPTSRIQDKSRPLPLMLVAYWNLEPGKGYVEVLYHLREARDSYDRDGWSYCLHDGHNYGLYVFDEDRMRAAMRDAVEAGSIVYFEDRRAHSNIRFLHGGPAIIRP